MERESKFSVKYLPKNLSHFPNEVIRQGYLAKTSDDIEIRLRHRGKHRTFTVKKKKGSERFEREVKINLSDFRSLWPLTKGKRLEKIRYKIPYGKYKIELDRYRGRLKGLFTAEVEFKSPQDQKKFQPPEWFDKDISHNTRYSNWKLATRGWKSGTSKKRGQ
jgi:CYTH domain-containing protein